MASARRVVVQENRFVRFDILLRLCARAVHRAVGCGVNGIVSDNRKTDYGSKYADRSERHQQREEVSSRGA